MVDGLLERLDPSSSLLALLCLHCQYPLVEPRQVSCGDRICADCYGRVHGRKFVCKKCGEEVSVDKDCFRDKAVEYELSRARFPCLHPYCPWSGSAVNYQEHIRKCDYASVRCPNVGCNFEGVKRELVDHLGECPAQRIRCRRCQDTISLNKEHEHLSTVCPGALIKCRNNCSEKLIPRKEMQSHLENDCSVQKRSCPFSKEGCKFMGDFHELLAHNHSESAFHLKLVTNSSRQMVYPDSASTQEVYNDVERDSASVTRNFRVNNVSADHQLREVQHKVAAIEEQLNIQAAPLKTELSKLKSSLNDLQESFSELSLMVQSLQATSYNGEFIWKIPDVDRRVKEAKSGITISLYSAPFFTSRFGYKMCLRLYLNGDGSGKGTHLSFFLTIMRGEYDALLSWPFQQMVTLMLLDQDKGKDIIQAFRPEPASSSFWKPKTEMNIASGCPKFAPLSVLDNPRYVRNDVIFFKVVIDRNGVDF